MAVGGIPRLPAVCCILHAGRSVQRQRVAVFRVCLQTPDRHSHRSIGRQPGHIHRMDGRLYVRPAPVVSNQKPPVKPGRNQDAERSARQTVRSPDGKPMERTGDIP